MSRNPAARELLLDSEATLRLAFAAADDAAGQIADPLASLTASTDSAMQAMDLCELIRRVNREFYALGTQLRASQDALRHAGVDVMLSEIEHRLTILTHIFDPRAFDSDAGA